MNALMNRIWKLDKTGFSPSEVLVMLALGDAANTDGVCWPAWGTIAAKTGLSCMSVYRALGGLKRRGLVQAEQHRAKGRQRSNNYKLVLGQEDTELQTETVNSMKEAPAYQNVMLKEAPAYQNVSLTAYQNVTPLNGTRSTEPETCRRSSLSNANPEPREAADRGGGVDEVLEGQIGEIEAMGARMIEAALPELAGTIHPTALGRVRIAEFLKAGHSLAEAERLWAWVVAHPRTKAGALCVQPQHAFPGLDVCRRRLAEAAVAAAGRGPEGMKLAAKPAAMAALREFAEQNDLEFEGLFERLRARYGGEADWTNSIWANVRDDARVGIVAELELCG